MQVRKRPLNKKESAKNEEDIIETNSNCLTVHETKLKVSSMVKDKFKINLITICCFHLIYLSLRLINARLWELRN